MVNIDPKLQTAGIITGAILIIGLLVFLLIPVIKALRGAFEGLEELGAGLDEAFEGVGDLAGGAGATVGAVGNTGKFLGSLVEPATPDRHAVSPGEIEPQRENLRLQVVERTNTRGAPGPFGRDKKNFVKLRVVANGRPVPGASVSVSYVHKAAKFAMGDKQPDATGFDGTVTWRWKTPDLFGEDEEDDAIFRARHPDYNPSKALRIG